jgi:uncharacterized protein (DUF1778 family)
MKKARARVERLGLRLEPEEKEAFEQAAELAGVPVSAWIRERLRAASRRELIESGRQVPFIQRRKD